MDAVRPSPRESLHGQIPVVKGFPFPSALSTVSLHGSLHDGIPRVIPFRMGFSLRSLRDSPRKEVVGDERK